MKKILAIVAVVIFATSFNVDFPYYVCSATSSSDTCVTCINVYPKVVKAKNLKEAEEIYNKYFFDIIKRMGHTYDPKRNDKDIWKINHDQILTK